MSCRFRLSLSCRRSTTILRSPSCTQAQKCEHHEDNERHYPEEACVQHKDLQAHAQYASVCVDTRKGIKCRHWGMSVQHTHSPMPSLPIS
eukprot:1160349-Pelagomonas_calceolata.AAC.9